MKLLLIEDDQRIALFTLKGMRHAGYRIDHAADGEEGLRLALKGNYALLILDLMLPGMDGLEVIRQLRAQGHSTPILILSAKNAVDDRVQGLRLGADDYLGKPFSFSELLARVEALVRRSTAEPPSELRVADLRIDLLRNKVFRGPVEITLQPLEYMLLVYLMRHAGKVVAKTTILEQVWEYNAGAQTKVVEARICRLREKIDRDHEKKLIQTVWGVGYVLETRD
ncbi:MAG: response regulator transcription factor [Kiritimatiellales bacterium]|nr:response regulator transcription factor [Kiritimatiellales bacterium]